MSTKIKAGRLTRALLSSLLALAMIIGLFPVLTETVHAAQQGDYYDPALHWLVTNNRTSELDTNAITTDGIMHCTVCDKDTMFRVYRVPEYTRSGGTALNRGVLYSDGTMMDGVSHGNTDAGVPGVNAYYTGYHLTKNVCMTCGTLNANGGVGDYGFNRDVYNLYDCAAGFMVHFSDTHIEPYNSRYHTEVANSGQYCQFCFGTYSNITTKQVSHNIHEHIDPQIGNNRFLVCAECDDCGYDEDKILTAKTVITSYYGMADGRAHTLTLADLSDSGVNTSIRYGNSAANCNLTSAPNYVDPGFYTVYYRATYSYGGESMTENGVSYVQLYEAAPTPTPTPSGGGTSTLTEHAHDYHYLDTVQPSCVNLGWENWQCRVCGSLDKRNYKNALGHTYNSVTVKEATCTQSGMTLVMCNRCGDFHTEVTPMTAHNYSTKPIAPTCKDIGYTQHKCSACGVEYVTDIVPYTAHRYLEHVTPPTCTERGYTTHKCEVCGVSYVDTYTPEAGHRWNAGEVLTSSTCESEGIKTFTCTICGEKMQQAISAKGHKPGAAATCTEPQKCSDCGAILQLPTGHHYHTEVVQPTCAKMGYTIYTCEKGDDSYIADYTDKLPHKYKGVTTPATCTTMGFTAYTCADCGDSYIADYTEVLPHKYKAAVTAPTCTEMGYSVFTCSDCGAVYTGDYVDAHGHEYIATVTPPTCTDFGYTTYTCKYCGESYKGDTVKMTPHNYLLTVTPPTCTAMGFTTYVCADCDDAYIADYTDVLPHRFDPNVIPATCTSMGHTIFTCLDCGERVIGDYTDVLAHDFLVEVTAPTCTTMGFTTHTCPDCGAVYTDNYADPLGHDYDSVVTAPTCTEMGYTTYTCSSDEHSYIGDYTDALGHTPSEWIIDAPATLDADGSKHIECLVCGEILLTEVLKRLDAEHYTDNDGRANVGKYTVIVTDKDTAPVPHARVTIDAEDNITVELPDGRLLDYADRTTVTVLFTETEAPAPGLHITVTDNNENFAVGTTDEAGRIIVPASSTGTDVNGNGTIGGEDGNGNDFTYVVVVTDKDGGVIDDCGVSIGENGKISVTLPDGTPFDSDNPVTVTVTDNAGNPQSGLTIIIGDESGETNTIGKVTLPPTDRGYTNDNGLVKVSGYIVIVENTKTPISRAFVTYTKDDKITVLLPEPYILATENQTTVTVLLADDETPVKNIPVTVVDTQSRKASDLTNIHGKITVPPLDRGYTDEGGIVRVDGLIVKVEDTAAPIKGAYVVHTADNKLTVLLPDSHTLNADNQTTVTVILTADESPVKNLNITVSDANSKTATKNTDTNGKIVVPDKPSTGGGSTGGGGSSGGGGGGGSYSGGGSVVTPTPAVGNTHTAYIVGYPNSSFQPDGNMTRAEAAAIFARLLADKNGDTIRSRFSFPDIEESEWCAGYVAYLKNYGIIMGYPDGTFGAENTITRAEFTAMSVRFYAAYTGKAVSDKGGKLLKDVQTSYWAAADILAATANGWIVGYPDGTFRAETDITRAEVVTVVNRVLGRKADTAYIDKNISTLKRFNDISTAHWAYYDVMEAANTHSITKNTTPEAWAK